jgi:type III restriction enzyme
MSFRTANDSTYIAQLMGRIVRTPLHRRVDTDEVLNNVHLFLPYFDKTTVDRIVKDLNS